MLRSNHQMCSIKKLFLSFAKFITPVLEYLFNTVAGLKTYNFVKKRL